jgi:hypothetical protein
MPADRSLRALRGASPRGQTGFGEWIERFDPLREQILAAPVSAGLLQEGTADLRAPAGITEQVARRRRPRLALRSVAAVATALAAVAVALAVAGVPGKSQNGSRGPTINTAYVVKRVDSALSAAESGDIAQVTITSVSANVPGGQATTVTVEEWSHGSQWRLVKYSSAGQPIRDEGVSSSSVYTVVNYRTRSWTRQPESGQPAEPQSGGDACHGVPVGLWLLFQVMLPAGPPPTSAASAVRAAISCGTLTAAGRQRVDGTEAIELTNRPDSPVPETIWVSPATYLPLRVVLGAGPGQPFVRQTADMTWLQPTTQNLAKLKVPIPAGFRHVSPGKAGGGKPQKGKGGNEGLPDTG